MGRPKKVNITKEELEDLYNNKQLSAIKIGKLYNCSEATIQNYMKKYGIIARKDKDYMKATLKIPIEGRRKEILYGALLGDGCLQIRGGINANFTYCSKSLEHVQYVTNIFSEFSCGIKIRDRFDKRTMKYYHSCDFTTRKSEDLTIEYYKWYINGKKHIPQDLILTPTTCLIWYLGDGSLIGSKNSNAQHISLYTNCFEKKEIEEILLPQLQDFHPKLIYMKNKHNKEKDSKNFAISIANKKDVISFIDYIGECPVQDYNYKWNIKPSLLRDLTPFCNEWKQLKLLGATNDEIADMYNCSDSTISNYLKEEEKISVLNLKKRRKDFIDMINKQVSLENISLFTNCNTDLIIKYNNYIKYK